GLEVRLRDPLLDNEPSGMEEQAGALRDYYKLVADFIRQGGNEQQIGDFLTSVREVPGLDTRIGLASWILEALSDNDETLVRAVTHAKVENPARFPLV